MRKIILFVSLIVFLLIYSMLKNEEKTIMVMNYEGNSYQVYELNIEKMDLSSRNIIKYFNNYIILDISPYINPIYKSFIKFETFTFDNTKSNEANINKFEEIYIHLLKDNSLNQEIDNIKYNGVKIDEITIYATESELKKILYQYQVSIK